MIALMIVAVALMVFLLTRLYYAEPRGSVDLRDMVDLSCPMCRGALAVHGVLPDRCEFCGRK